MLVSIIIINYNTFHLTCQCIKSIIEHTKGVNYEVILVDNASKECNPDEFLEKFPTITLVKSTMNGGFAKGNNWGIEKAIGDFILLLNSDTYLVEDSISQACTILKRTPNIGALGVRMVYEDGKVQHSARMFRSIRWELLDLFRFILTFLPYQKRSKLMMGKYFKSDFSTFCDWVNGAFMMFPKAILNQFPKRKLDERFFMYGEDQLWCYQFQQKGFSSYFFTDTTIVHINNGSTNKNKQLGLILTMIKNELIILKERKGSGIYFLFFCIIYLGKEYSRYAIKYLLLHTLGKRLR